MVRCLPIYRQYIEFMNQHIRDKFETGDNPFEFKHINNLDNLRTLDGVGPCVVMASPGMLQNGHSRKLFEQWCDNPRNGVVMPGYSVRGTLAHQLLNEPENITRMDGVVVPCKIQINASTSFSAHSDFAQTSEFLQALEPQHIVLVHGDAREMANLAGQLKQQHAGRGVGVYMPQNCETLSLEFAAHKTARLVGSIAMDAPEAGQPVRGLAIQRDLEMKVLSPEDLAAYSTLAVGSIEQRVKLPFEQSWSSLQERARSMYSSKTVNDATGPNDKPSFVVLSCVTVTRISDVQLVLEWTSHPVSDMVADSLTCLVQQLHSSPNSFAKSQEFNSEQKLSVFERFMNEMFGNAVVESETIKCALPSGEVVEYHVPTDELTCADAATCAAFVEAKKHLLTALEATPDVGKLVGQIEGGTTTIEGFVKDDDATEALASEATIKPDVEMALTSS